ncbi:MAG: hypothetical protein DMG02_12905, partial [Acidobacteria bacterium]
AVLAGGSALLVCPAPGESETSQRGVLALASESDCARDGDSSPAGRWSARLVDDENSADSTDDDGDDAPDGVIAAAPHRIDVALNSVLLTYGVVMSVYGTDFDNRALRGPPAGVSSDSSQDSDDDDGDDAPDAVVAAEPIRPIDLAQTLFIRTNIVAAYTVDVDAHALRGPPSPLPSDSSDVGDEERPALDVTTLRRPAYQSGSSLLHRLDDGSSFGRASGGQSLRAPP